MSSPLMSSPRLLVVAHCPSDNTLELCKAVLSGAQRAQTTTTVRAIAPLQATAEDVLDCDGIILGTTENFGYMSGALKDFFDRIYTPCLEVSAGLPYALYVKGGMDGTGATRSVETIVSGLRWKAIAAPLVMSGAIQDQWVSDLQALGKSFATGLEIGVF